MKLHVVLKEIVDEGGIDILYDERFVNYISDYYPDIFKPLSLKKILKYVLDENYTIKIVDNLNKDIERAISKYSKDIEKKAGFSELYTTYILKCIAYAVGYETDIDDDFEESNKNISTIDDCHNDNVVSWYGPSPQKKDIKHLIFKDEVFFGKAKSFVDKMCEKGFTLIEEESDNKNYMLNGSYAGIPCKLMVQISPKTHRTSRIIVIFDDKVYQKWSALKALYFNLKDKLTKKYGKPSSETEAFFPPYKDGDGNEIELIDANLGVYQTKYNVEGGEIRLVIVEEARVVIAFMDTIGCIELNKEFEEAAQDDM